MFDTMLVSTTRRGVVRTPLFLIGTAAVWMLMFTAVVVIGIFMYDAKVSAESEDMKLAAIAPPAAPAPPARSEVTISRERPVADPMRAVRQPPQTIGPPAPPRPAFTGAPNGVIGVPSNSLVDGIGGERNNDELDGVTGLHATLPPPTPEPPPVVEQRPARPSTVNLSKGVLAGRAIRRVEPPYPTIAKQLGVEGAVVVEVNVSERGEVLSAHAVSGHPTLRMAAETAARQWRFSPTLLSDVPVKVVGTIVFNFKKQ
jgi:TonB family protein